MCCGYHGMSTITLQTILPGTIITGNFETQDGEIKIVPILRSHEISGDLGTAILDLVIFPEIQHGGIWLN